MLFKLLYGLAYLAVVYGITGFAAYTGSVPVGCAVAFTVAVGTLWLSRQNACHNLFPRDAMTTFAVLGILGAHAIARENADEQFGYWFTGVLVASLVALVALKFMMSDISHERTR